MALNHSVNLANSQFNVVIIVLIFVLSIWTVVLSANIMENKFSDSLAKSLIYKINSKGPSMDPCGTLCVLLLTYFVNPHCEWVHLNFGYN